MLNSLEFLWDGVKALWGTRGDAALRSDDGQREKVKSSATSLLAVHHRHLQR